MSQRRITDVEFQVARELRDGAVEELLEVLPKLRTDAFIITIAQANGQLALQGCITGDTSPYEQTEVLEYMNALGVFSGEL